MATTSGFYRLVLVRMNANDAVELSSDSGDNGDESLAFTNFPHSTITDGRNQLIPK